jgi:peptide-methionine (S)-S-oxide reductase
VPVPGAFLEANGAKLSVEYWAKYGPRPGCTIQTSNDPITMAEALKA